MSQRQLSPEERKSPSRQRERKPDQRGPNPTKGEGAEIRALQQSLGNRGMQRLAQRLGGQQGYEVDESTAQRIDQERTSGQPLDNSVRQELEPALGIDLGQVRIHASSTAGALARNLKAKAFTSGRDIFFSPGAYDPHSSEGRKLLAHELTHVVQQSSGRVPSSAGMKVSPPGDALEQEAEAVAQQVVQQSSAQGPSDALARQPEGEEEELQMQPMEEEEEELQMQVDVEEEEEEEMLS